jgi:hypothetical protein
MEKRRPARKQQLPKAEATLLNDLFDDELYTRVNQLYAVGWTLQAIGNLFEPKRTRSTIRFWVNRQHTPSFTEQELPRPRYKARGYVLRRPKSPGIDSVTLRYIEELAPVARRYRAKMSPSSAEAKANSALTDVCIQLIDEKVTVRELSEAAGVTYRAMARRLGR